MSEQYNPVFTIGHSTHSIGAFVGLLRQHGVTELADVRSAPFSRFNPQFNKNALEGELISHSIRYVFLGRELGARSDDPSCYEDGRVQYARLSTSPSFHRGIGRLKADVRDHRVAVMCAEREPLECHRTLLVARALDAEGMEVNHILSDGSLERHQDTMERLLDVVGLPHEDLFRSKDELVTEALSRQEDRIAYKRENLAGERAAQAR